MAIKGKNKSFKSVLVTGVVYLLLTNCTFTPKEHPRLPILGEIDVVENDTIYHTIPPFSFINQNGDTITDEITKGKIYVADFFFTTCRTICPTMKRNMLGIYDDYCKQESSDIIILSHSLDPEEDTPEVLASYKDRLGVTGNCWHFLTGSEDAIYNIANKYLVAAVQDGNDPDGITHSGAIALIDKKGRIRGLYDGTDKIKVTQLIEDIAYLKTHED